MIRNLAIISIVLLTGCLSLTGQPRWVEGKDRSYPESKFLSATGVADKAEDAKTRALANLAKIFEVQVDEATSDNTTLTILKADGQVNKRIGSELVTRFIDSYSSQLLEGARIAEQWYDEDKLSHHALAVISRKQLMQRLSADINMQDRYIATELDKAANSKNLFKRASRQYKALLAQRDRDELQTTLQIADTSGKGIAPKFTAKQINQSIDNTLSKMKMQVISQSTLGLNAELSSAVKNGLAAANVNVLNANAQYQFKADLDVQNVQRKDGWYWYRGALEISVHDKNKKVIGVKRWPLKVSAQTKSQAKVRLKDQLVATLKQGLKEALLTFEQKL